jgi:hypothetical protein
MHAGDSLSPFSDREEPLALRGARWRSELSFAGGTRECRIAVPNCSRGSTAIPVIIGPTEDRTGGSIQATGPHVILGMTRDLIQNEREESQLHKKPFRPVRPPCQRRFGRRNNRWLERVSSRSPSKRDTEYV